MRVAVEPEALGFTTTDDLVPAGPLIGQERAMADLSQAAAAGTGMPMFVMSRWTQSARAAVCEHLRAGHAREPVGTPAGRPDWVYVTRFDDPARPMALALPSGLAMPFAQAVAGAIAALVASLPAAFETTDFRFARRALDEESREASGSRLEALKTRAENQNIALLRTPKGYAMAPMHEGRVVKPEVFAQLPQAWQRQIETRIEALSDELASALTIAPVDAAEVAERERALERETAESVIDVGFAKARALVAGEAAASAWLRHLEGDILAHLPQFVGQTRAQGSIPARTGARLGRYRVHVLTAAASDTVFEARALTRERLTGSYAAAAGAGGEPLLNAVKAGALHRGDGGVLVVAAAELLACRPAWDALTVALRARAVRLSPIGGLGPVAALLEPDPVPFEATVVIAGSRAEYDRMAGLDPDFARQFGLVVSLEDTIARTPDTERHCARLIAGLVKRKGLKPVSAHGVAALIEAMAREAGPRDRLASASEAIADLAREADHWAAVAGREATTHDDVRRALDARFSPNRSAGTGARRDDAPGPGSVTALAAGEGQWGARSSGADGRVRITAHVRMGEGRPADIVRVGGTAAEGEVGSGADAVWGYLAARFGAYGPLALAAILDHDAGFAPARSSPSPSPSPMPQGLAAAEALAILSALAEVPLDPRIGVAGGLMLSGELVAVEGINAGIERLFKVCEARGLEGGDGVVIPRASVGQLMVSEAVQNAVARRLFTVHACASLDEALEVLCGKSAGTHSNAGRFEDDTVNGRVGARLAEFAARRPGSGAPPDVAP